MKLLARIVFLLLTIACGLWTLVSAPRVFASLKNPDEIAAAIGGATIPLLLFVVFFVCWAKLRPDSHEAEVIAPQSAGSKVGKTIAVIFLGALIALIVYVGIAAAGKPSSAKFDRPTQVRGASWATRTIKEVTLDSPSAFQLSANQGSKPSGGEEKTDFVESYELTEKTKNFHVGIGRIGFKQGVEADLDSAVDALVAGVKRSANRAGDTNPKVDVKPSKLGNLEARTFTYLGKVTRDPLRIDGIYVQEGQKMWYVMVVYQSDHLAPDAARIIKSLRISNRPN